MNTWTYVCRMLFLVCLVLSGCGPSAFLVQPVPAERKLAETQIDRDEGFFVTDKIAVIDVDGFLANRAKWGSMFGGENAVSLFVEKLDKAKKDPDVKAVVLRINSHGGTVAASDTMHHALLEFRQQTRKPVVACVLDTAASGAYLLACGSNGIVAQPGSVTGSIGTVLQTVSFAGTMEKLGIKAVAIKSGKLKDIGSPLRDMTEEEREVLQGIIEQFYEQFVSAVDSGRQGLNESQVRELADGRVFTGTDAVKLGLVDRIGHPSDAIKWAKELAGVQRAKVVIYHRPLSYKPNVYSSEASTGDLTGALVNIELPDWLKAEGCEFLYVWQPEAD
jgi:protease-4